MVSLLMSRGANVNEVCPKIILDQHSHYGLANVEPRMDEDIPNEYPKACKNCALTLSTTTEVKYYGSEVERKVVHKAYAVAPVHLAARYQCRNGPLQKLLAAGADPNITYSFQLSNDSKKLYEMKKFVDKYYPYIGAATISALHDTRNIDHVAILARAGSNMAANDSLGFYPLGWSILAGDVQKVKALLHAGSPITNIGPTFDAISLWYWSYFSKLAQILRSPHFLARR